MGYGFGDDNGSELLLFFLLLVILFMPFGGGFSIFGAKK